MRITLFAIFLFLPLLSFAQLKEFKILKLPDETGKEIFTRSELDSSVYVFVYVSNNFGKTLKFEPFMKWSVEPKYNEEKSRWELFVPIELKQKISIWADGYNAQEISIPKTSAEVTTDATVVNSSGKDGVLADAVNCSANLNINLIVY